MPDKKKEQPTPPKHTVNTEPSQSFLSKMFTPMTDMPSRMARDFTRDVDRRPTENPILARGKGFLMGAAEGAGDLLSDMTSPASMMMMAVPEAIAMRRAMAGVDATTDAARNIGGMAMRTRPQIPVETPPAMTIDLGSEFNNADDVFQHYWNQLAKKRGMPGDVPENPVAQRLESERRAISRNTPDRRMPPPREETTGDKKISNLQAQFRRSQMKRVK